MAMSPVAIFELFLSILKQSNVVCQMNRLCHPRPVEFKGHGPQTYMYYLLFSKYLICGTETYEGIWYFQIVDSVLNECWGVKMIKASPWNPKSQQSEGH